MKTIKFIIPICAIVPVLIFAQSGFTTEAYLEFLEDNKNLESATLLARHAPQALYYSRIENTIQIEEFAYLDSTILKYELTESELDLLQRSRFTVSERLSFDSFRSALYDIFHKDLPVFVTTDAILHALHASYDNLLIRIELSIMRPQLANLLGGLHAAYPQLLANYQSNPALHDALADVDLYVTIAKSLLEETQLDPQYADIAAVDAIWEAVQAEQMTSMPLFMEGARKLDFSQFTVRGHYTQYPELGTYFKSMMWLGRIDFALANPPAEWGLSREGLRRMNLGAVMMDELVQLAGGGAILDQLDEIIEFLVGESDNLTPTEFAALIGAQGLAGADDLLDDATFDTFQEALKTSPEYGQQILSMFIRGDYLPGPEPVQLPVSYRLMGQRFIIDSYIFSNVVYDRIVYQGAKVFRMMPDPLDAMFALGNDDALPLLKSDLDRYPYSAQLASMRYLVEAYDDDYWGSSLYNVWLQAIRLLNPPADQTILPVFMQTTAWHQQKLNTQLASWTQLRHDNLLYAKQSYTGGIVCSFPHSYVEPYPAFYRQIGSFAEKAGAYFTQITQDTSITYYFPRMQAIMDTLGSIAQKELDRQPFTVEEAEFLKRMLFVGWDGCAEVFGGWYLDLFYTPYFGDFSNAGVADYLVADVHTQPTDEGGNPVGRVLHVGVGEINLGIFLADAPSNDYQPMAYVGPVMSYYEKITENFDRLTDERWEDIVLADELPARPDWVNIYLADGNGDALEQGRELSGIAYLGATGNSDKLPDEFSLSQNYPNPFNPATSIRFELPWATAVSIIVCDIRGREVVKLVESNMGPGNHQVVWDGRDATGSTLPSGIYIARLSTPTYTSSVKMLLLK